MSYAIRTDGQGWRAISGPSDVMDGETYSEAQPGPREPTAQEIIREITAELEAYYDSIAKIKDYDSRITCAMRAGYVGPYQTEGQQFGAWLDACIVYGYQVQNDCLAGKRGIPTAEELIAELPAPPW